MKTSMLRWRQKIRPSKVASLHEYLRVINLDKWIDFRKYSFGTITVNPIVVNNETIAVILGDLQFLALLNNIQELHIDAMFEVCPRNISNYIQILTIMATVSDTVIILFTNTYFYKVFMSVKRILLGFMKPNFFFV